MRRSRLQETSMEVTVGAFMFMVLLALGFFTIVLSSENIFARNYVMEVMFKDVRGLREGDNVFIRGVDVGKIRRMEIRPEGVLVTVSLGVRPVMYEDYRIEILPSSVLGGRYLNIYQGSESQPVVEQDVYRGEKPVDLIDEATRTAQMIKEALEEGQVLENLKATMGSVRELTAKLNEGQGTLGRLISDDALYLDLQSIAANLKDVSQRLGDGQGTIGRLLSEEDTLYDDLAAAAASIRKVTESISQGEGTLGRLTGDDQLYEEVKMLVQEVRAAVDDFRETTPITTFTSVFFGAF